MYGKHQYINGKYQCIDGKYMSTIKSVWEPEKFQNGNTSTLMGNTYHYGNQCGSERNSKMEIPVH